MRTRLAAGLAAVGLLALALAFGRSAGRDGTSAAGWIPLRHGELGRVRQEALDGASFVLGLETLGTRSDEVKSVGYRGAAPVPLTPGRKIRLALDWNGQENGSYLSGGLQLSDVDDPSAASRWVRIEYVGVPPGRNARLAVTSRDGARNRLLFGEGWPEANRAGKPIGVQELEIEILSRGWRLTENGLPVYESPEAPPFAAAWISFHATSHGNYPYRELVFSRVSLGDR